VKALSSLALVALLCGLTLAALLLGDGDVAIALVPALLLGALYAAWKLPLRYPVLALTFLALTLENPSDAPAAGLWRSPLYPAGTVLLAHLNLTFPSQKWLAFSGLDVALVYLYGVALARRIGGSRAGGGARVESASPMRRSALVSLGGAAFLWLWGLSRGGADVASSLWQVQRVVSLPLFYFLFERSLRGPGGREALGKVVLAAAILKACLAIYVRATVPPPAGEATLAYATTHADSMLFAGAFCLVAARLVERVDRRRALLAAIVLPLLAAGMIANHRRVVWVELAAGLAAIGSLSRSSPPKRAIARAAVVAAPIVALYLAVGWGHAGGVFAPVEVVRSVVDSKADASTEWRDWENYDLFVTLKQGPLLGTGYGHGYVEAVKLPDISQAYALYRFIPHNSILGLWAYGGIVGFTALWSVLVVGVFLAARSSRFATTPEARAAAAASTATIAVYLVHCYGDMGLGTWTSVFTVAPAFAVTGQLATETGAWPRKARVAPRAPLVTVAPASPSRRPLPEGGIA
jgi:O-Antigen ligase